MTPARTAVLAVGERRWAGMCLLAGMCVLNAASARGDGPKPRWEVQSGNAKITIFTDATPTVGEIEVSVMLQPIQTGRRVSVPAIEIFANPVGAPEKKLHSPARQILGGANKPVSAGQLQILDPGPWEVEVKIDDGGPPLVGRFVIDVEEGYPSWVSFGMWVGLPAVAALLFIVHRERVARRKRSAPAPASPAPSST